MTTLTKKVTLVRTEHGRTQRLLAVVLAVLGGIVLAVVWSGELADDKIGESVANSVLGHDAAATSITGLLAGTLFAFVSGFAATFTACNIAVFGALPSVASDAGQRSRAAAALRRISWLALGLVSTAAVYGFVAVLLGSRLPQLSTVPTGSGIPQRLVQSMVVFAVIGLAFAYLGVASLGLVPDPFAARPRLRLVVLGVLIGGFLVGRPYPLFFRLLGYAVRSHDPFYGALVLVLQSLGNVLVVVLIALLASSLAGTRAGGRLSYGRALPVVGGIALLLLGMFLVFYWDVRLPAQFGHGWFPKMPWNG